MNSASRLSQLSRWCSAASSPRCQRYSHRPMLSSALIARKANIGGPIGDWAKLCTLLTMPLRVLNVPRMTSRKVRMIRAMFQTLSIPRFSWIITLCRKAVPVSQGSSAAFSTGSQPQ